MIEQLLNFISQNEGSSMLPVVGDYLLKLFTAIYSFWFALLIKISSFFIAETYFVKTVAAFASFFITIYTLLYAIKKIMSALLSVIWFALLKIYDTTFGLLFKRIRDLALEFLRPLKRPIAFFKNRLSIRKKSSTESSVFIKHSKVVSIEEIEEFERQLKKRGYSSDCFELREEAIEPKPYNSYNEERQLIAIFKETGKWKTYRCGGGCWVENIIQDLDNKAFNV